MDTSTTQYSFSANWLKDKVYAHHGLNLNIVNGNDSFPPSKRIILGNPSEHNFIGDILNQRNIGLSPLLGEEGYILEVFNDDKQELITAANTPNGVFYGVQTLLQLISPDNSVEGVSIVDYPDHKMRAIYISSSWNSLALEGDPPQFTEEQKEKIDQLANLKINTLIYGVISTQFFQESPDYWLPYKEMADYCRERFIDFIPAVPNIKNNNPFPFQFLEGRWVKDEKFKFNQEEIAVPEEPFINLLGNGGFEIDLNNDNKPDGWNVDSSCSLDNTNFYEGKYSLKIENGSAYLYFSPLKNGKDNYYYLTVKVKGGVIGVSLSTYNNNGQYPYGSSNSIENEITNWKRLAVHVRSDDEVNSIKIEINKSTGNLSWIDDIRLYRLNGALKNVIRTETTDIEVSNLDKSVVYQKCTNIIVK